jgi:hypothetical protein
MFQKFVHRALPQEMPGKRTKSRSPERIQDANAEITGLNLGLLKLSYIEM